MIQKTVLKIGVFGDSIVGKTCLINNYIGVNFWEERATIGIDYYLKAIKSSDNNDYLLRIIDIAGIERFRIMTLKLLKNCKGIILVYSIDNKQSFENIRYKWINDIKDHINISEVPIILVGNKKDLENERIISKEEGRKVAEDNNFLFFETSAKTGENINEIFKKLIEIVPKDNNNIINNNILNNYNNDKIDKEGKCIII